MIYRQRNKKRNFVFKSILTVCAFLFVMRLFNVSFVINMLNYPVHYILNTSNVFTNPLKNSILYFKNKNDLEEENKKLKQENIELRLNQIVQQSNVQEFDYFVKTFGTNTQSVEHPLFRVISKPPFLSFDMLKITGDLSRYNIDEFVFYKHVLIGKVVEKNNTFATVKLFSSPEHKTPITVKGSQFEAIGLGSGRYTFEVAKDFEIQVADIILYPNDKIFVLGVVDVVETKEEDLFKKVYFNIPVPLSDISYVSIGMNQSYEQQTQNSN